MGCAHGSDSLPSGALDDGGIKAGALSIVERERGLCNAVCADLGCGARRRTGTRVLRNVCGCRVGTRCDLVALRRSSRAIPRRDWRGLSANLGPVLNTSFIAKVARVALSLARVGCPRLRRGPVGSSWAFGFVGLGCGGGGGGYKRKRVRERRREGGGRGGERGGGGGGGGGGERERTRNRGKETHLTSAKVTLGTKLAVLARRARATAARSVVSRAYGELARRTGGAVLGKRAALVLRCGVRAFIAVVASLALACR